MSASSEYESTARQDYGPTTSSENVYDHVLDHKLTDNMNIQSIRTPVLRAVPLSSNEGDPEPDSTNHESIIQTLNKEKEVEYHIAEKRSDSEMSVDTLANIVRIDETNCTIDNVGRIAYPIIQEVDDSNEGNYVENSATLIQGPLSTAIVQNVTKLPQNFTINVDAAVSNITTIQNVSQDVSGAQTLWLPTILATSAAASDAKTEDDRQQPGVSQIIITSESYGNDNAQVCRRSNIVTETSYITRPPKTSKVQILSNISLPKYSQQYITQTKELVTPVYATQSHVYKLSTNVVSQKHINSNMLCTKQAKTQSLIGCTSIPQSVINSSPIKNVAYGHTFAKSTNMNKTLNKVNNGANLNSTMVAATSGVGGTPCHILSRVMSGPNKMSVHSGRKSVNTLKGSKSGQAAGQKNQSRPIKIIQQMGSAHKSEQKSWPVAGVTYKSQPTIGVIDANTSKIIQKVGSPTSKSSLARFPSAGERLVLQSPCGPVLLSTAPLSSVLPRAPHYVQSGATPNLRYVHTYGADAALPAQVSANQQLTAQILQSLSQPKLMLHAVAALAPAHQPADVKPLNQKRIVMGDKSTLLMADDLIGMEERPNLSEELRRYSFQPLAFIMLDHTYSLPAQKQPSPSPAAAPPPPAAPQPLVAAHSPAPPPAPTTPLALAAAPSVADKLALVSPPAAAAPPMSPLKRTSPVIVATASYEPIVVPSALGLASPMSVQPPGAYRAPPPEDDAASVASSADDEPAPAGGSDTETAPEGEDEGKTRCICEFTHDDGYMICCDRCGEWQHVDCMGIDRQNIPDAYMCEVCQPRLVDRRHARAIQLRKREELSALAASDSDESEAGRSHRRRRLLTVTTYTDTSGSCVTTYNAAPSLPALPLAPLPPRAPLVPHKRPPKRHQKKELVRKGAKRKIAEKRVKRKKEIVLNRSGKYGSSLSNQSHWQDAYELAVTNHYSPELRAKIVKYSSKLGSQPNMSYPTSAHLCTTVPHAGGKILIATKDLKESTPVIELRGKYMLSTQHRPQVPMSRAGGQKPGPFVFFYRLPKDNTQICIDTRTYGNEARFVRRSCKPNAELRHCIVKGTLHVYLVTIGVVQSNTEITVGHDSDGSKHPCACGNPKHCKVNGLNSPLPPARKSMDYPPLREKRSRNRCFSSSSPVSPPLAPALTTPMKESPFIPSILTMKPEKSPIKYEYPPLSPAKPVIMSPIFDEPMKAEAVEEEPKLEMDLTAKEEMKPEQFDEPDYCNIEKIEEKLEKMEMEEIINRPAVILPIKPEPEIKLEEPKPVLTPVIKEVIEEKPVALPIPLPVLPPKVTHKVAERRKSRLASETKVAPPESKEIIEPIKKEEPLSDDDKPDKPEPEKVKTEEKIKEKEPKVEDEKPLAKEVTAKSACYDRSSRSSRTTNTCVNQDSLDDKTDDSQDKIQPTKAKEKRKMTREERKMEAIMKAFERMEKAEQRKQEVKERQKRRESDPHPNAADRDDDDDVPCHTKRRKRRKGRARTTSQSNRRRLNSADSDLVTSGDERPPSPPLHEDTMHQQHDDLGLSPACLLVEAAVGSVENAFKLPKTKKTMATEWIGRSPERTPSPYRSPYRPALVAAPSLESLVRVASTMIGDLSGQDNIEQDDDRLSPPRTPGRDRNRPPKKSRRITRSTPPTEVPEVTPLFQHSAKKRWLRQAISEESDAPTIESPPSEIITPLKKRRLARESLSCEPNTVVPCIEETSPVLTSEDSPVKDDPHCNRPYKVRNIMDSIYGRDRTRSDSGQGSDDQCNMMENDVLNVNIKGPHAHEDIRRIIGVPTPEDEMPPDITKPEDIRTNNNNVDLEESNYNKAVPMEIDTTTIPQPKIQDTADTAYVDPKRIESPTEKLNSSQSADTSGNSSPQRDEMDDIQKKIHSFHTENIMILKSRNKKPKEKRKKVNLNFDLNMVDDQISIQLRTEDDSSPEMNGDADDASNDMKHVSPENIPLPPDESIATSLPAPENIPLPEEPSPMSIIMPSPETIPLPEEPMKPHKPLRIAAPASPVVEEKPFVEPERPSVLENSTLPFTTRFGSGLFSGIFNNITQPFNVDNSIIENVPTMSLIKSAIDRTTALDGSLFDKDSSQKDDMKSVQEILTRVNNMDTTSSVILSGVLKSSNKAALMTSPVPKTTARYCTRTNDPRLNPPPVDKPKPIRRKLSISEYRKRHLGASSEEAGGETEGVASEAAEEAAAPRLDAAVVDDLELRLHRELADQLPKGVFDAQPTASERQREDLSSRLRREFGLALPEEAPDDGAEAGRCDR